MPELPPPTLVDISGAPAAVYSAGDGPAVLMLHGWGASAALVWPLAAKLAERGLRAHVVDLPGFGHTLAPTNAWSVFDYATWALHIMDALDIPTAHLFGHSFGGRLALILAAEHPQRFKRVVLANSAGLRPRLPLTTQLRTHAYKGIRSALVAVGARVLAEQLRQRYNARYGSSDFNAASGIMRETFIRVINQDLSQYAARVLQPTLLFWGDQDTDTPLWMGQTLEKLMPDAALIVHKGAGHYSYLDRLAETAHIMSHFLLDA
ncbi:MAG: alpha/beta hydrolase [Anaerolineae bacterium]